MAGASTAKQNPNASTQADPLLADLERLLQDAVPINNSDEPNHVTKPIAVAQKEERQYVQVVHAMANSAGYIPGRKVGGDWIEVEHGATLETLPEIGSWAEVED